MGQKAIRFGVVGLGMGRHHCVAINNARGAELAAICDKHPGRLAEREKEFKVKAYQDYAAMLKDPDIDVVSIVTESSTHADLGIAAVKAGKHILVEKPVDITPARINKLERAVAAAGVKCGCIFQARMEPCSIALKKAIEKGKMGRMIGMHGTLPWYRGDDYFLGPFGPWRGTWTIDGGGSMMNQGIHTIDQLIFLGGPVKRVCGFYDVFNHNIEAEDLAVACLQYENGALGTVFTTTCANPGGPQTVYGFGTKGSFRKAGALLTSYEMGGKAERKRVMEKFGDTDTNPDASKDAMAVALDGHTMLMEDMARAIKQDREPIISLAQARHAVEVVCAVYKAANTGRTIEVARMPGARATAS